MEADDPADRLAVATGGHSEGSSAWLASIASINAFVIVMRSEARPERFS